MTDNNKNTFLAIKEYGRSPEIIERFAEIVGKHNAGGYVQSAILAVANNEALQKCTPQSIFSSALRAATIQLLCEPSLGQAYLVPFKDKATLIIGYKGLYQLALRTGKYRFINVSPIYDGEMVFEDRMTGEVSLNGGRTSDKVIGYLASFQLTSGFSKSLYMTIDEIYAHADRYSKSINISSSPWKTNRVEMERKTVLRLLLSRYGYLDPKDALAMSDDPELEDDLPEADGVTIIEGETKSLNQVVEDLGFEPDDDPEDEPEPMTIEKACTIKNTEGKPYFELTPKDLNKLKTRLTSYIGVEIDEDEKMELETKLQAISVLLKAKAEGSIQ